MSSAIDVIAVQLGGTVTRHMDAVRLIERLREHGYAIVPVEPTREMWAAGGDAVVGKTFCHHDQIVGAAWPAMIAAATL